MLFLLWGLGPGSVVVPGCLALFWGTSCPKERAISMFPSTSGSHTSVLHFIALSSDSLTTASWHKPHPDSSRQNVQDTGPGLEQGVTGSWAGPLGSYTMAWDCLEGRKFLFFRRAFPRPLSHREDSSSPPGALKPAFPALGRSPIWALLPAPLPRSGWNLRQSRK